MSEVHSGTEAGKPLPVRKHIPFRSSKGSGIKKRKTFPKLPRFLYGPKCKAALRVELTFSSTL